MNVVIDTSVLIAYLRGEASSMLEEHLENGNAFVTPVVCAEILSGTRNLGEERAVLDAIADLPITDADLEHWFRVGRLRNQLRKRGLNISTPDAHIAQSAIDNAALLFTRDQVFEKIARETHLKISGG